MWGRRQKKRKKNEKKTKKRKKFNILTGVHRQDVGKLHQRSIGKGPVGVELAALERGLEDVEGRDLGRILIFEKREREKEVEVEVREKRKS